MKKILLLSIYPDYCNKILNGKKRFEYRTQIPIEAVSHIIIYATSPIKKIVGIAQVEEIIEKSPHSLWEETKYASGIERSAFRTYFKGRTKAYAIRLGEVWRVPVEIAETIKFSPPQSFCYFDQATFQKLKDQLGNMSLSVPKRMIFIAGIHGVGKTFFCKKYLLPTGYTCKSASSIIKENQGEISISKNVANINKNQDILLSGIKNNCDHHTFFALDGHFTLINKNNDVEKIPFDVFEKMHLKAIVLLTDDPLIIKERLLQRDKKNWDIDLIIKIQSAEIEYANEVAKKLAIPLSLYDNETRQNYRKTVSMIHSIL